MSKSKSYDDEAFKKNFKKALDTMRANAVKGVKLATAFVKVEAQKRVPVDHGVLKASAYTTFFDEKSRVGGEIGFTAKYSKWVHEAPMTLKGQLRSGAGEGRVMKGGKLVWVTKSKSKKKGRFWDVQGQATNKFLFKAYNDNLDDLKQLLKNCMKL